MTLSSGSGIFAGQRAQKPHLVRGGGGLAGEVADLRTDISADLAANVAMAVDEYIDEPTADVDAFVTSIQSEATEQTYSGAGLDGVVGEGVMDAPRNVTITTSSNADIDAVDVVIDGTDINGQVVQDTITLTDAGNVTDVGVVAFKTVTLITIPAQSGTGGLIEIGFGSLLGLSKPIKQRGGAPAMMQAIEDGTITSPAGGTTVDAATGLPNGTYDPGAAPDASRDYALYYEYDATQNV